MPPCDECTNKGTLRCSGCQSGWYCSKECQKKAWPAHKLLCKTFKDFQVRPVSDTPNEKYTRAIYFHPEEEAPRFVWFKTELIFDEGFEWLQDYSSSLLANNEEEANSCHTDIVPRRRHGFIHNYALARELPHTIFITYRDSFLQDGSKPNNAIRKVIDLRSRHLHDWRGPIIAFGTKFQEDPYVNDPVHSEDLTTSDLRPIVHWLNTFRFQVLGGLIKPSPEDAKRELGDVVGVRMNCLGDEKINGRPRYEHVTIPAYHRIFEEDVAPISERLGFPILVQRIPGSVEHWKTHQSIGITSAWVNQPATYLQRGCDPNVKDSFNEDKHVWGWAPRTWRNNVGYVGSVIVVRKDKKPLLPEHAEALAEFCQFHLGDIFQEHDVGNLDEAHVLEEITKGKFIEYYTAWKAKQKDARAKVQVSPYDN